MFKNDFDEIEFVANQFYDKNNIVYVFFFDKLGIFIPYQKKLQKFGGGSETCIKFVLNVLKQTSRQYAYYNSISERSTPRSHVAENKMYKQNRKKARKIKIFDDEEKEIEDISFYKNLETFSSFLEILSPFIQNINTEYIEGDFVLAFQIYVYDLINKKINLESKNNKLKFVYVIFTADSDLYQLISTDVYIYDVLKKKLFTPFTIKFFLERDKYEFEKINNFNQIQMHFGKTTKEIFQESEEQTKSILWRKILKGDKSDNINQVIKNARISWEKIEKYLLPYLKKQMSEEEIEKVFEESVKNLNLDFYKYIHNRDNFLEFIKNIKRNYKLINLTDKDNVRNMLSYKVITEIFQQIIGYIKGRNQFGEVNLQVYENLETFLKKHGFYSLLNIQDFYIKKVPLFSKQQISFSI